MKDEWPHRWDLLLRYRLIEIIALWEGRLTTNALVNAFGIGRQQASKDINTYITDYPENLIYDKTLKGYRPSVHFKAHYTRGEADEYLQLLSSRNDLACCFANPGFELANTSVLYSPVRKIKPEIIRPVVQAAREKKRIEIEYSSLSTPVSEGRVIAPHTLVWSGFRWHMRAYCEKNKDYRDFVLSRLIEPPVITLSSDNGIDKDEAWNTPVVINIKPDARLKPEQKKIIATEYGMKSGRLKIPTRGALVTYMLQMLRIDPHISQANPEAQQIEIDNIREIKKWIFE
ncbi:MAG: WYL domain-containing protein [Gammaproteobacteria bacterium]|nr:WYL domain-containing protein [Gammaproteobacteria bacterium]